jgi:hypothetical protein
MALTKISGGVLQQPIDVGIITASSANFTGIVTAGNTVVGGATTELVVTGSVHIVNRLDVGGLISAEESAIMMNPNSISRDTTIPSNYNARTIGPDITINSDVSVTVSSNGEWTITK